MRWTPLLAVFVCAACFDPTKSEGDDDPSTGSESGTGNTSPTTSATTTSVSASETTVTTTTTDDTSTSATTSVDESTSTAGSSDDASDTTTGGELPPICDHMAPTLAACDMPGLEDVPNYNNLSCDSSVTDFSVFYEDVYTLSLVAGQCVYVHVDNVGINGPGLNNADLAFQLRSPSGAYAWADDEIPCTDPVWTGAACPLAMVAADVDGIYELAIVQASGSGCVSGDEYMAHIAIDGASVGPTLTEDVFIDCAP